jgi:hypothetical protein
VQAPFFRGPAPCVCHSAETAAAAFLRLWRATKAKDVAGKDCAAHAPCRKTKRMPFPPSSTAPIHNLMAVVSGGDGGGGSGGHGRWRWRRPFPPGSIPGATACGGWVPSLGQGSRDRLGVPRGVTRIGDVPCSKGSPSLFGSFGSAPYGQGGPRQVLSWEG